MEVKMVALAGLKPHPANEKLGRICYGMEIEPKYCDVIIKRWENYTGKTARKG